MSKRLKKIGWAIKGDAGLYIGWWFTRERAKEEHARILGCSWDDCKKRGDEAVKVEIKEASPC